MSKDQWAGKTTPGQRVDAARELLKGLDFEVTYTAKDREHIVQMSSSEVQELREFLARPSGSYGAEDVSFDAVQHGGLLVRTQPYAVRQAREKARSEARMKACKDSPTGQHNSVRAINGDTNEPMGFSMCGYCGRREYR